MRPFLKNGKGHTNKTSAYSKPKRLCEVICFLLLYINNSRDWKFVKFYLWVAGRPFFYKRPKILTIIEAMGLWFFAVSYCKSDLGQEEEPVT